MNLELECINCKKVYKVNEARFRANHLYAVTCRRCNARFFVQKQPRPEALDTLLRNRLYTTLKKYKKRFLAEKESKLKKFREFLKPRKREASEKKTRSGSLKVACTKCRQIYNVDEAKIPANPVYTICEKCKEPFLIFVIDKDLKFRRLREFAETKQQKQSKKNERSTDRIRRHPKQRSLRAQVYRIERIENACFLSFLLAVIIAITALSFQILSS